MVVNFDRVAFSIFGWPIHWYGLMYLIGILFAWGLGRYRARRPDSGWTTQQVDDMVFYGALGVILGGRLGYIFFYNFSTFISDPLMLLRVVSLPPTMSSITLPSSSCGSMLLVAGSWARSEIRSNLAGSFFLAS